MDPDGYIRIDGRSKDIVIRGGENISVVEVESLLYRHPRHAAHRNSQDLEVRAEGSSREIRGGMTAPLTGKVAFVNGCARRIGRAYGLRLARLGANVLIADLNLAGAARIGGVLTADTIMAEVEALGRREPEIRAQLQSITLRRFAEAENMSIVPELLATGVSSYATGQVISACGGVVLHPN